VARFITLNAFLLDVRLLGLWRLYKAAPYLEERLAALPDALRPLEADVICLQEVFRKPYRRFLADRLGDIYPHSAGIRSSGMPPGTGLMVLSRHPIESARTVEFRAAFLEGRLAIRMGMLDCTIRLPDLGRCRVINVHLAAGGLFHHPESRRSDALRRRQIAELLAHAEASGLTIICGDLNSGPDSSLTNYRQVLDGGFVDAFAAAAGSDNPARRTMTWDPGNPLISGDMNRALPAQRIDHILLGRACADDYVIGEAGVVLHEPRVLLADGQRVPLSDHYGLAADILTSR
jgi:endonuclease/exonuclease/phosphatase family metal-dependent hydrolase